MVYKKLVWPILFRRDPETVHNRVLQWLRRIGEMPLVPRLVRAFCSVNNGHGVLTQKLFDMRFPNPVGLAAGMDKNGVALTGFGMLGFGFIEMGGVTNHAQDGNPTPRIFRLPGDKAIINRMGFPGWGAYTIASQLAMRRYKLKVPLGINVARSTRVPPNNIKAVAEDYCATLEAVYEFGDFFTINVSCINVPGMICLQQKEFLNPLLTALGNKRCQLPRHKFQRPKPLLVKIGPDLEWDEIDAVIEVSQDCGFDGIVATNTTAKRDGLRPGQVAQETGGLSGKPLRERALEIVRHIHKKAPTLPIIGVGGIFSAEDAWEMLQAGASLVQVLTGLVYEGPLLVREINRGLVNHLKRARIGSIEVLNSHVNRS